MGVLPECAADARPTRLGSEINLRMERDANSYCQIFFADKIRKLFYQFGIPDCGKPQGLTPLRKIISRHCKDITAEMVAWIGCNGDGDAKPCLFGMALQVVVPARGHLCTRNLPQVKVIHFLLSDLIDRHAPKPLSARLLIDG